MSDVNARKGECTERAECAVNTYDVLGIPISVTSLDDASKRIHAWSKDNKSRMVFIRDVHGVMQAKRDPKLMQLHQDAAMITPDGMPLVWLGQLARHPVKRTCGPDLMERVIADSERTGLRHFFYGGKPNVAQALKSVFEKKFPKVKIVGCDTPPFRSLSQAELHAAATEINESGTDVVWIGISTPKQEFLMRDLCPLVAATLIGVGAAFDFHLGTITRAPKWMQRSGLEWTWRLVCEPRRLWRRYLIMAPQFVYLLLARSVFRKFTVRK